MKGKRVKSGGDILDLIHHMETDLEKLKKALLETKQSGRESKRPFRSFREFEFCGMWKNRDDMIGLSSAEWLAKIRSNQWR